MIQPKFKFGDKVTWKKDGWKFIIRLVYETRNANGPLYKYGNNPHHSLIDEDELDLFQEPQKEKLFAFKSTRSGSVIYRDHQWGENQFYRRFPGGDKVVQ